MEIAICDTTESNFRKKMPNNIRAVLHLSLLFVTFNIQNISANSQDVPKIPAVISQTEFDYQGTHFVVQLIPSSDAVITRELYNGGGVNAGDFVLTCNCAIVLRHGSDVLAQFAPHLGQFVNGISDLGWTDWTGNGEAPILLLTRKDKLPLIVIPQYGSSNGSNYYVFLIQQVAEKFEIKSVQFSDRCYVDSHQQSVFGSDIRMLYDQTNRVDYLRVNGYDNSIGNNFTIYYMADYNDEAWWELVEYRTVSAPIECSEPEG
jgi:hypothetical protein